MESKQWTNGVTLVLSDHDQEYLNKCLEILGVKGDYNTSLKSLGIYKFNNTSTQSDEHLIGYKFQISEIIKAYLPLRLTSNKLSIIKPWNKLLGNILWFDLGSSETINELELCRNELNNLLEKHVDDINKARNKEFNPHITLIYDLSKTNLQKDEVQINNLIKELKLLPHEFVFETAQLYLSDDKRININ